MMIIIALFIIHLAANAAQVSNWNFHRSTNYTQCALHTLEFVPQSHVCNSVNIKIHVSQVQGQAKPWLHLKNAPKKAAECNGRRPFKFPGKQLSFYRSFKLGSSYLRLKQRKINRSFEARDILESISREISWVTETDTWKSPRTIGWSRIIWDSKSNVWERAKHPNFF